MMRPKQAIDAILEAQELLKTCTVAETINSLAAAYTINRVMAVQVIKLAISEEYTA